MGFVIRRKLFECERFDCFSLMAEFEKWLTRITVRFDDERRAVVALRCDLGEQGFLSLLFDLRKKPLSQCRWIRLNWRPLVKRERGSHEYMCMQLRAVFGSAGLDLRKIFRNAQSVIYNYMHVICMYIFRSSRETLAAKSIAA